jgi:23S rRNA (cytidine1920-2'-O)/16S rRNA (cytidine1409-2'-O)-methyltransferase
VGKGGVVRDPILHQEVQDNITSWLSDDLGWQVHGIVESSITGPEGNREFIVAARKPL